MDSSKYLVLIEDNPDDVALTLRAFARSNLKNEVLVFSDGVEALEFLHSGDAMLRPEVILLDVKLPRLDGLEVLARLRADQRTRFIPVVMLTTSQEQEDLVRSYTLGANSYIRKPVDFSKFTDVMQTVGLYWLVLNESARA